MATCDSLVHSPCQLPHALAGLWGAVKPLDTSQWVGRGKRGGGGRGTAGQPVRAAGPAGVRVLFSSFPMKGPIHAAAAGSGPRLGSACP